MTNEQDLDGELMRQALHHLAEATTAIRALFNNRAPRYLGQLEATVAPPINEEFLDAAIDTVDFGGSTTRLHNVFHNGLIVGLDGGTNYVQVRTVRDLVKLSECDLLRAANIGPTSVARLKAVLALNGLRLSGSNGR